ncbi:hypothetical protein RN001_003417 [Aquatica leii]|uniref:THAP-type domain-containing protein n=1 Tax=Aquatica leii TaxID=1421715 RepID=A0AAN7SDZ1_9COLE|nr:hypothetical protein RN001_003417 [Aquatica leii]
MQEKVDRRKAWEKVLLMEKSASNTKRVCSLHFIKEDLILPDFPTKVAKLKKTAVPSQNLPQKSIITTEYRRKAL